MNRGGLGVWCSESVRHGGLLGLLNFALCFVSMDEAKIFKNYIYMAKHLCLIYSVFFFSL